MSSLLIAAHGTRSPPGQERIQRLVAAVARARPAVSVAVGFLDVQLPSLADALSSAEPDVVIVPALLSTGYHVVRDIPDVAGGRRDVRVARHLGPDPLVVAALADRLAGRADRPVALVAAPSSDPAAETEARAAASLLTESLDRAVETVILASDAAIDPASDVAAYLLAEGTFYTRASTLAARPIAAPLADHPAIVELVWLRYDQVLAVVQ